MAKLTLIIGNKNYSSWSLRPWLALKQAEAPFEEVLLPLFESDWEERIRRYSPSGKVPVLQHGEIVVWESLAICEYAAETFPATQLWPRDAEARALARSVSAEMHAGFSALRSNMPMNLRKNLSGKGRTPEVEKDIRRILQIWENCRRDYGRGGPFLFGAFSVADAMYAPVVTRFKTYGVAVGEAANEYCEAILSLPAMREWTESALKESWVMERNEV